MRLIAVLLPLALVAAPSVSHTPAARLPIPAGREATVERRSVGTMPAMAPKRRATATYPGEAFQVRVDSTNPGANIERSACVTVAIRPNVDYECGDLRVSYSLPGLRYFNKNRAPTMLYNSQHAKPTPIVRARVTPNLAWPTPLYVRAILRVNGIERKRQDWAWASISSSLGAKLPTDVALSFDASGDSTGLYPYTFEFVIDYGAAAGVISGTTAGELAIVNRATSAFGPGWWLAGYERLIALTDGTGDLYWIGGDGSTRRYVRKYQTLAGAFVYQARSLAGSDSLLKVPDGTYQRQLAQGAYIQFDASGRHASTVDALGRFTQFSSAYGCGRLGAIRLSDVPGQPFHGWSFNYDRDNAPQPCVGLAVHTSSGALGTLNGVTIARGIWRNTQLTYGLIMGVANVNGVTTLTGDTVIYNEANGRISTWRDERGTTTTLVYGSGGLLTSGRTPTGVGTDSVIQRFRPADSVVLAAPAVPAEVYTALYSPRPESSAVTKLWLGPWGNPLMVTDGVGRTTTVLPHATFPLLTERVTQPSGHRTYASYDSVGRLRFITADPVGGNPSPYTRYYYDNPLYPDNVTQMQDAAGVWTKYTYNGPVFNTYPSLSEIENTADAATRVSVTYCTNPISDAHCLGLPKATLSAQNAQGQRSADTLAYDALGNLARSLSHDGKCTEYVNDGIGRVTLTRVRVSGSCRSGAPPPPPPPPPPQNCPPFCQLSASASAEPGWLTTTTTYDALDRVDSTQTVAPADPARNIPEQRVRTATDYLGATELALRVWRSANDGNTLVDSARFDALGRPVLRWAQGLTRAESLRYDPAGNLTRRVTPRGHVVTMEYDALNRLTRRILPPVLDTGARLPLSLSSNPNEILGDTAVFTYDPLSGELQSARNADALVWRQYLPNGALSYERQEQRASTGGPTTAHMYVTQYEYDVAGRRRTLWYPWQAAAGMPGYITYAYRTGDGALQSVTDPSGAMVSFGYDPRGQLTTLTRPGGVVETMAYTADGELAADTVRRIGAAPATFRRVRLSYDVRGKLLLSANTAGPNDILSVGYTPMGHAWVSNFSGSGTNYQGSIVTSYTNESYVHDALGTVLRGAFANGATIGSGVNSSTSTSNRTYNYHASGRLQTLIDNETTQFAYDSAGNTHESSGHLGTRRHDYYNALNQLVASDAQTGTNNTARTAAFSTMRYDALGRRIAVARTGSCLGAVADEKLFCATSYLRRTAWDGQQELAEFQGGESDTGPVGCGIPRAMVQGVPSEDECPLWGQALYVHGGALDAPIGVVRSNYREYRWGNTGWVLDTYPTFVLYPHWTARGEPDGATIGTGNTTVCVGGGTTPPCAANLTWPGGYTPYMQQQYLRTSWLGSLVENKRESGLPSGLTYRRNRYVDGTTGRFTQPDPIGLAGGLNSYGYAQGDPVNFSDPFGLCGPLTPVCVAAAAVGTRIIASPLGQRALERSAQVTARASAQIVGFSRQVSNMLAELSHHDHLSAARLERTGRLSTGYQHAQEVADFANGLRSTTVRLKQIIGNDGVDAEVRAQAAQLLSRTSRLLDQLKEALR